ncbi:DUF2254 domain-containing protein [Robertmurraya korlensis]|uniref:DUF2254 domain-containing protein n=1 Tax=Robertmurraya korlensis TaxID=519977 RepID=UPI0008258978|nr:DUF2254 domain-containing protein [Robertmurraya korlensis]
MMKKLTNKVKNSLWLLPSLYSGLGLSFAIITTTIDTYYLKHFVQYMPEILLTSVELAITILATLSSALLTMTTFTFSIIMVVLTTYSSQFSPRALPNFMTAKTTMRVLGIFLGGFVYSIYSLLFMRKSIDHEYVISAVLGVFFAIICLLFFIHFIHYIGKSIQVDFLIEKLTNETFRSSHMVKDRITRGELFIVKDFINPYTYKKTYENKNTGYIQKIEIDEMILFASRENLYIEINCKIGEFITEGSTLFTIYSDIGLIDDQILHQCESHVTVSHQRSTTQDMSFSIQKLVEIALRATSPAINDPFTAKHCIRNIGKILSEVSPILEGHRLFKDKNEKARLFIPMENLENLLYFTFYEFDITERKDLSVLGVIFDALIMTAQKSSKENKQILWGFSSYITYKFYDNNRLHDLDKEFLQLKTNSLYKATH